MDDLNHGQSHKEKQTVYSLPEQRCVQSLNSQEEQRQVLAKNNQALAKRNSMMMTKISKLEKKISDLLIENIELRRKSISDMHNRKAWFEDRLSTIEACVAQKFEEINAIFSDIRKNEGLSPPIRINKNLSLLDLESPRPHTHNNTNDNDSNNNNNASSGLSKKKRQSLRRQSIYVPSNEHVESDNDGELTYDKETSHNEVSKSVGNEIIKTMYKAVAKKNPDYREVIGTGTVEEERVVNIHTLGDKNGTKERELMNVYDVTSDNTEKSIASSNTTKKSSEISGGSIRHSHGGRPTSVEESPLKRFSRQQADDKQLSDKLLDNDKEIINGNKEFELHEIPARGIITLSDSENESSVNNEDTGKFQEQTGSEKHVTALDPEPSDIDDILTFSGALFTLPPSKPQKEPSETTHSRLSDNFSQLLDVAQSSPILKTKPDVREQAESENDDDSDVSTIILEDNSPEKKHKEFSTKRKARNSLSIKDASNDLINSQRRRTRGKTKNYTLPSLRTKMRRTGQKFADAIGDENLINIQNSPVKSKRKSVTRRQPLQQLSNNTNKSTKRRKTSSGAKNEDLNIVVI